MKILLSILAVLLLPLSLACGDGSGEDAAPTQPPATATSVPPTATPSNQSEAIPVLPAQITDIDGNTIEVTDVSRIVPLNGDIAEVIWALGLGENVVGVDTSATYPGEASELPSIGYQRSLSAEGILSLNPTVIIGNEAAGPVEVLEQIRGVGVPVVIIPSTSTLDGVGDKIRSVAAALGVPNRGEELAAATQEDIDAAVALAAEAESEPRVMFLYLRGAQVQVIMGQGSGADSLITAAGAIDLGAEAGIAGSAPLTPEALVAAQPDVILVLTAGLESVGGVDGLLEIPGIAQTPAGQNRAVIDLEDQYLLGMGPRVGQALMELVKALHPELA